MRVSGMETENPEIPKEKLIGCIKKRRMKKQTPFAQCPLNKFLHNISFILIRNNTACSNDILAFKPNYFNFRYYVWFLENQNVFQQIYD